MRRSVRRAAVVAAGACAAVAVAPGTGTAATPVQAGDFAPPTTGINAFLPNRVTVRQGDQVTYAFRGFHNVTFPKRGTRLTGLVVPTQTPAPATPDPAGQPYWWAGIPQFAFNPQAFAPSGGTVVTGQRLVGSGIPGGRNPRFTVRFPRTGSFPYFCTIHPGMKGTVRVVPRSASANRLALAAARTAKQQRAQLLAEGRRQVRKASRIKSSNRVSVGFGTAAVHLFSFFPARTSVPAGSTVNFQMAGRREVHTVTFGPKDHLEKVGRATFERPGPVINPEGFFPSDPPPSQPVPVTATSHGNGFVHSGIMTSPGIPGAKTFRVRFDQPGTYQYICLVHPEMRGRVTVT